MQHAFKRTVTWRTTALTALLGLAMLALVASSAQAKVVKVTGDQATIAPSTQLSKALSDRGVTVGAIDPATLDGSGNLTVPIVGGQVNTKNLNGVLAMSGGLKLSKGERSLKLRRFVAANSKRGAVLSAKVGERRLIVARLTDRSAEVSGTSGTVEADLRLSKPAAKLINHIAGKHLVSAGALLGHVSATVTTG